MYDLNMHLSRSFTLRESVKSQIAIRRRIVNMPNAVQLANMIELCVKVAQPIRDWYNKSVVPSSFFRCNALNKAVKGSKTSQHCTGEAMDFDMEDHGISVGRTMYDIVFEIKVPFDQLILEFGEWVHISYSNSMNEQRGEIFEAYQNRFGKTKYRKLTKDDVRRLITC